jgi:uncharacterized protein YjbI with pentapeptide repeats
MTSYFRAALCAPALALLWLAATALADTTPYQCPFCSLAGTDFSGQNLTDANLQGADLSGANFSGATLSGAELAGANLANANLSNAVLTPSASGSADLSGANLTGANVTGAQMQGADLTFTNLAATNFAGADLTDAQLGPAPRTGLHAGRKTSFSEARLPNGLKLDAATTDTTGAHIAPAKDPVASTDAFEVNCGSSDLSQLSTAVYVRPNGADGPSCGSTFVSACKTIGQAVTRCTGGGCGVLVGFGSYTQTAPLNVNGNNLYGGCVMKPSVSTGLRSRILAPDGGVSAVSVAGGSASQIQGFKIVGSPASVAGTASVALQISNTAADLADMEIYAAPGAAGTAGCNNCMNSPDVKMEENNYCDGFGVRSPDTKGTFTGPAWNGSYGGNSGHLVDFGGLQSNVPGGGGGQQGGGSFAVVALGSMLQFRTSRIVGGRGGRGGDGGLGRLFGLPAGAPGNGGPAIGIVTIGDFQMSVRSSVVYGGLGGPVGSAQIKNCKIEGFNGDSGEQSWY